MDDFPGRRPFDLAVDRVSLELPDIPRPVDLEVGPQLEEAAVRGHKGASADREQDQRSFVLREVLREQLEAIRIPPGQPGDSKEHGAIERGRVAQEPGDGVAGA